MTPLEYHIREIDGRPAVEVSRKGTDTFSIYKEGMPGYVEARERAWRQAGDPMWEKISERRSDMCRKTNAIKARHEAALSAFVADLNDAGLIDMSGSRGVLGWYAPGGGTISVSFSEEHAQTVSLSDHA